MARTQIRDIRQRHFFWCDNIIIDTYARRLGPYALAVYMGLLRHADQGTQSCFPSLKTLADELGMTKDSVIKSVEALKKAKLVSVKHRKSSAGDPASNLYLLRGVVDYVDYPVDHVDYRSRPRRLGVVDHVDPNNTQLNNTHEQDAVKGASVSLAHGGKAPAYSFCEACQVLHQPGQHLGT
jgi:hypothetical protein